MIGNKEIWDKGIGMGATQTIFSGQPSAVPNYNPMMQDPNAQQQQSQPAIDSPSQSGEVANIMVNGKLMTMTEYEEYLKKTMSPEQYASRQKMSLMPAKMAKGYDKDGNPVGGW